MSAPQLPAPGAIIFDWDNTLVDTWPIIHKALNDTFRALGKPEWTMERTMAQVSRSMRDSFPGIFGENWQDAGKMYQQNYRSQHLDMLTPLPGVREMLDEVHACGVPLLVVSNKMGKSLREEVAHLGWGRYFDSIIGATDAARDKPFADPVHLALSQLERAAGPDVWFIGDSEVDLETAAAAGCTPILYGPFASTHTEYTPTHYRGHAYHVHVLDHEGLRMLLGRHCGVD